MTKKAFRSFKSSYEIDYATHISQRDPKTMNVLSVCYQFCVFEGRKTKVGCTRKNTGNINHFKEPF